MLFPILDIIFEKELMREKVGIFFYLGALSPKFAHKSQIQNSGSGALQIRLRVEVKPMGMLV